MGIGKLHETIDVFNTILVNGVRIENPEGKSAKALLRVGCPFCNLYTLFTSFSVGLYSSGVTMHPSLRVFQE